MNICIDINNFSNMCINFLDSKRNIIMDGKFTKLLYSNQYFTMNGIFLNIELESYNIERSFNKSFLKFNPNNEHNSKMIKELHKIESQILDYYKVFFHSNCKPLYLLSKQLNNGNIKILCDKNTVINNKSNFILKISGVWETYEDIGLTFKLQISH